MNPRVATALAGTVTLLLGCAALVYPDRVLGFLGFMVASPSQSAAALGEVRATYGGVFVVLGAYTLAATFNPAQHRSRLVLLALVWFGACAGRLFGVSIDGNPGLFGWVSVAFELVMGGLLALASVAASSGERVTAVPSPEVTAPAMGASPPV